MKRVLLALAILTFVVLGNLRGQGEEPKKVNGLMKKKLQHSQKVLEGIVLNDFKGVVDQADELMLLSKEAEWRVFKTPSYELYSNEFRRAVDTMAQKARDKNIDGVTLAYVDMTMSCVRCHKYVREERKL